MKHFALSILNPFVWWSHRRSALKLYSFSLSEHGSMLDLHVAARLTPCPERAALYVRHANDEARHAKLFWNRATLLLTESGRPGLSFPRADIEHLFETLGEIRFLAFVHRGERRGRQQLESYQKYFQSRGNQEMAALFDGIVADERRHESYTLELLHTLASESEAANALQSVRRWELWQRWRRLGKGLTARLYTGLMWVLYLASLPLAVWVRAFSSARPGWRKEEEGK